VEISRRIFLQKGIFAVVAVCPAVSLVGWAQVRVQAGDGNPDGLPHHDPGKQNLDPYAALAHLDRESFVSAIDSAFHAQAGADSFWLRLLAVNDLPGAPPANPGNFAVLNKQVAKDSAVQTAGFMLLFSGPVLDSALQGTYTLSHETLGEFELFIVPEASGSGLYNAVINRLSTSSAIVPVVALSPVELHAASPAQAATGQAESTSSDSGSPSPRSSGTRGAQRGAGKD
jgi:hypothetical protein